MHQRPLYSDIALGRTPYMNPAQVRFDTSRCRTICKLKNFRCPGLGQADKQCILDSTSSLVRRIDIALQRKSTHRDRFDRSCAWVLQM